MKAINLFGAAAGSVMEWYDFMVYGFMLTVMAPLFFPSHHPTISMIVGLAVFALGFFMRPLGALLYGHIGDTKGRKNALTLSVILMGIPSFCTGLLPTYHSIGIAAPILLLLIRLIQGLSAGGEMSGAVVFLFEHAKTRKAFYSSVAFSAAVAGVLLASLVATLVFGLVSPATMHAWAWRVPFFSGALVALVGFYTRKKMLESPDYIHMLEEKSLEKQPIRKTFTQHKRFIFSGIGIVCAGGAVNYTAFVFMPSYFKMLSHAGLTHIPLDWVYRCNTLALVTLLFGCMGFGWLASKISSRLILIVAALLLICVTPIIYAHFTVSKYMLLFGQMGLGVIAAMYMGVMCYHVTSLFHQGVRYTGFSFAYNVAYALFGGTGPLIAAWLFHRLLAFGHAVYWGPSLVIMLTALISLVTLLFFDQKET